jgi:hypothetical protein
LFALPIIAHSAFAMCADIVAASIDQLLSLQPYFALYWPHFDSERLLSKPQEEQGQTAPQAYPVEYTFYLSLFPFAVMKLQIWVKWG